MTPGMGDGDGKLERDDAVAVAGTPLQLCDEVQVVWVVEPPSAPKHSVFMVQSATTTTTNGVGRGAGETRRLGEVQRLAGPVGAALVISVELAVARGTRGRGRTAAVGADLYFLAPREPVE